MIEVFPDKGIGINPKEVRLRLIEREDYVKSDDGQMIKGEKVYDENGNWKGALPRDSYDRVIMAVSTDRADGSNDLGVFAPAARATLIASDTE